MPCVYTRRGKGYVTHMFPDVVKKAATADDSAVDKLSVVQRDFDLFKREQERERKRNLPPQDGEIMLDMEVPPSLSAARARSVAPIAATLCVYVQDSLPDSCVRLCMSGKDRESRKTGTPVDKRGDWGVSHCRG